MAQNNPNQGIIIQNTANNQQQQVQQEQTTPYVESIKISANLIKSFEDISKIVSNLEVFSYQLNQDNLILFKVESRDLQKKPFLFFVFSFYKDYIEIQYSIAVDASKKLRRITIIKNFLSVLSLISNCYEINLKELFQHLDSIIDDLLSSLSQSYSTLFNNYDSIFNQYKELKLINNDLAISNKNLAATTGQLTQKNKELSEKLKDLETYSDESLMVMIEEWIESHDNTIDINEFAKSYKIIPPRVEQILNKMVSLGYLELKE
ncbi:MAG: hypothetical protein M1168_01170 [Candidatus Marsarchaeota archaeon]|nr:hypothetical protein [Candidatus Marsarchaeota archaeon]MCL5094577.1 hypothetical protein [Candidatus Marsarchaeota archaeon]